MTGRLDTRSAANLTGAVTTIASCFITSTSVALLERIHGLNQARFKVCPTHTSLPRALPAHIGGTEIDITAHAPCCPCPRHGFVEAPPLRISTRLRCATHVSAVCATHHAHEDPHGGAAASAYSPPLFPPRRSTLPHAPAPAPPAEREHLRRPA
ncbi:hypothetical protein DFH06DRAFT_1467645 [Mycena polygramma]|nr:hypothetical protein DFH06DRAFT_1467645 [Mycena polygramma]